MTLPLSVQYIADLYEAGGAQLPLSDDVLVNARLITLVSCGLSVYLVGENHLDRQYKILADYPMPGRTIFLGAT